jgi:hypothetical protein
MVGEDSLRDRRTPILLERIEPSFGRGERIPLARGASILRIGRAKSSDIQLFTATASREHAILRRDASGQWQIAPVGETRLLIDGEPTATPTPLEVGMNFVMGGDQLRCVATGGVVARGLPGPGDDSGNQRGFVARPHPSAPSGRVRLGMGIALMGTTIGLFLWFGWWVGWWLGS